MNIWAEAGKQGGTSVFQQDIGSPRDPVPGIHLVWGEAGGFHGSLSQGVILGAYPFLNCYRVSVVMLGTTIICSKLSGSSLNFLGVKEHTLLLPMTRVLVWIPDNGTPGIILGVMPSITGATDLQLPDFIVPLGMVGIRNDQAYTLPALEEGSTGLTNFSHGRLGDILPGDWAQMNYLGVGAFVGHLMASIRGTDLSRLDCFYLDHLVRLNAYNFEQFGAGYELTRKDDEGEINEIEGLTPYPWEAFGMLKPSSAPTREGSYKWLAGDTEYGTEPLDPRQIGLWRLLTFRGYLGDLYRKYVLVPNDLSSASTTSARTLGSPGDQLGGLYEEVLGMDGSLRIRSAKSIVLSKDILIPVPQPRKVDYDPAGDSAATGSPNYNPAGLDQGGGAETHDKFEYPVRDHPNQAGFNADDRKAFDTNWKNVLTLAKHKNDYELLQPSLSRLGDIVGEDSGGAPDLESRFQANMPPSTTLILDHRDKDGTRYYKGKASIEIQDDGSIVLEDAWGSQIKLAGGNLYLTCPGDVWVQPGRNFINWVPKDIILRAGKSIDLTTTEKDIRLKAENNIHVLSGNSGSRGGILLESRAVGTLMNFEKPGEDAVNSGVVIKAAKSNLTSYTKAVYMRTLDSGGITVDADAGKGQFLVLCNNHVELVKDQVLFSCGPKIFEGDEPEAIHAFTSDFSLIGTPLRVFGPTAISGDGPSALFVSGDISAGGRVAGSNSHLARTRKTAISDVTQKIQEQNSKNKKQIAERMKDVQDLTYGEDLDTGQRGVGNDSLIEEVAFSCRTDKQYGYTNDDSFLLYESTWQQRARIGEFYKHWKEHPVTGGGVDTYPHPGRLVWTGEEGDKRFRTVDPQFYDTKNRRPKDRPYDVADVPTPQAASLEEGYTVTVTIAPP